MHGYQIKALWAKLFEIHALIQTQNWVQLERVARITDEVIEEAKIEIEDYPGEITACPFDEFTDAVRLGEFDGREVKRIYINQIHVF